MKNNNFFEQIAAMGENERVESMILTDPQYMELCEKKEKDIQNYKELQLGHEIDLIVDRMLCAYVDCSAYYGTVSYKQGMLDCVSLLRDMGVIR